MPVRPVGVDHANRHDLLATVDKVHSCGIRAGGRDGAALMTEGETLKKGPPRGIDGIGIFLPLLVKGLEDRGVGFRGK